MNYHTIINNFTNTQKERYNSIVSILGKIAVKVILHLKGRGRNSWKSILSNIQAVNNPISSKEEEYYRCLDESIDLDEDYYTRQQFTQIVSKIRFQIGWPAFEKRIGQQCEDEMFKLFIWENVYKPDIGENDKRIIIGYKPICRLRAD